MICRKRSVCRKRFVHYRRRGWQQVQSPALYARKVRPGTARPKDERHVDTGVKEAEQGERANATMALHRVVLDGRRHAWPSSIGNLHETESKVSTSHICKHIQSVPVSAKNRYSHMPASYGDAGGGSGSGSGGR